MKIQYQIICVISFLCFESINPCKAWAHLKEWRDGYKEINAAIKGEG